LLILGQKKEQMKGCINIAQYRVIFSWGVFKFTKK